jgi:hypothetical protein
MAVDVHFSLTAVHEKQAFRLRSKMMASKRNRMGSNDPRSYIFHRSRTGFLNPKIIISFRVSHGYENEVDACHIPSPDVLFSLCYKKRRRTMTTGGGIPAAMQTDIHTWLGRER